MCAALVNVAVNLCYMVQHSDEYSRCSIRLRSDAALFDDALIVFRQSRHGRRVVDR